MTDLIRKKGRGLHFAPRFYESTKDRQQRTLSLARLTPKAIICLRPRRLRKASTFTLISTSMDSPTWSFASWAWPSTRPPLEFCVDRRPLASLSSWCCPWSRMTSSTSFFLLLAIPWTGYPITTEVSLYWYLHTVFKNEKFTLTCALEKYFVKTACWVNQHYKCALVSRNLCDKVVRVNLLNFHTVFSNLLSLPWSNMLYLDVLVS